MRREQKSGFGLAGIIIVIAAVAVLGGGGLYVNNARQQKSLLQTGVEAKKKAEELKGVLEKQQEQIQKDIDKLENVLPENLIKSSPPSNL